MRTCRYYVNLATPQIPFVSPLYRKYRLGTTVFSGLAEGILTGKVSARQSYGLPILNPDLQYNDGIPEGSRLDIEKDAQFKRQIEWLQSSEGKQRIETIKKLTEFAQKGPSIDAPPYGTNVHFDPHSLGQSSTAKSRTWRSPGLRATRTRLPSS